MKILISFRSAQYDGEGANSQNDGKVAKTQDDGEGQSLKLTVRFTV